MRTKLLAGVGALALMALSSQVNAACSFSVRESTITATLNPAQSQSNVTAQGSPQLQILCTNDTDYTINANNGLHYDGQSRRVFNANANAYIPYEFDWNPRSGSAQAQTPITVNTQATFRAVDFQGKPAGTYTDTVTLTVNP